jgi:hypothetical protein
MTILLEMAINGEDFLMTALQFAFVLLCLVQIVHFSKHWYLLTARLQADSTALKLRTNLDWKNKRPKRR